MTTESSNFTADRSVWIAAGVLAAAGDDRIFHAHDRIVNRAGMLGVEPHDVAEYVQWRGHLPD